MNSQSPQNSKPHLRKTLKRSGIAFQQHTKQDSLWSSRNGKKRSRRSALQKRSWPPRNFTRLPQQAKGTGAWGRSVGSKSSAGRTIPRVGGSRSKRRRRRNLVCRMTCWKLCGGKMSEPKLLPSNKEAEMGLIGWAMRYHPTERLKVSELVLTTDVEMFHFPAHQAIWQAMKELAGKDAPLDPVTLADRLKAAERVQDVRYDYIVSLWDAAPIANVKSYLTIIRNCAVRREYLLGVQRIEQALHDPSLAIDELDEQIDKIRIDMCLRRKQALLSMAEAATNEFDELDRRANGRNLGLGYGFQALDGYTGGMHRKELIVVAARPSVGKSMFS